MTIKVRMSASKEREIPTFEEIPDSAVLSIRAGSGDPVTVVGQKRQARTGSWGYGFTDKVTLVHDGKAVEYQIAATLTVVGSVPYELRQERKAARAAAAEND